MQSRRNFLKLAAGAATWGVAAGAGMLGGAQRGTVSRRQVSIGNRRIKVIDIHGHFLVPEEADIVRNTNLAANVLNQLNGPLSLGPARLQAMDQQGVDVQALSHQGGWWYGTDRDMARRLIRVQNEGLATWCAMHPDRFVGLASVALQHPDLAAEQLEEAIKSMGMRGVGIAGHVEGEIPSSTKYDPFWAKAQELGALVFVHPAGGAENVISQGALRGRGDLGNIIGNPLETTVFLTRLIFEGTLDRFPALKICGAHAGGYLPSYLGRTDVACDVRTGANCANKKRPREYFKDQILVDSMIFSEEGLRHLVAEVGVGQVVYGTDMPYNWPVSVDLILGASFLSNADKEAILGGTLNRLLRIA
ncbi:MAG TPA: amidohydrolase family protein [Terriglobia bacterium]|nr:amidohydrolase family protein [Terriglobia bacterium]